MRRGLVRYDARILPRVLKGEESQEDVAVLDEPEKVSSVPILDQVP